MASDAAPEYRKRTDRGTNGESGQMQTTDDSPTFQQRHRNWNAQEPRETDKPAQEGSTWALSELILGFPRPRVSAIREVVTIKGLARDEFAQAVRCMRVGLGPSSLPSFRRKA